MSRKAKIGLRIVCLLAVLAVAGLLVYQAYLHLLKKAYPLAYEEYVTVYSEEYGVEPALIYAVMKAESGFDPEVVSYAGAVGLMQLMPETFDWLQTHIGPEGRLDHDMLRDPQTNIRYGTYFLSMLEGMYEAEEAVLSGYNAGIGTIDKWLSDPEISSDGVHLDRIPYDQTRAYVAKVQEYKAMYQKLYFNNDN